MSNLQSSQVDTKHRRALLIGVILVLLLSLGIHGAPIDGSAWMSPEWETAADLSAAHHVLIGIDTSRSITPARLRRETEIVEDIVTQLAEVNPGVLLQIFTFDDDIHALWPEDEASMMVLNGDRLDDVHEALALAEPSAGLTWLSGAIRHASALFGSDVDALISSVPGKQVLIVLTDGRPTTDTRHGSRDIESAMDAARDAGQELTGSSATLAILGVDADLEEEAFLTDLATEGAYVYLSTSRMAFVIAATSSGPSPDIFVANWDGSDVQRVTHTPDLPKWSFDWAPDGTRIVYAACEAADCNPFLHPTDLFVADLDNGSQTNLTDQLPETRQEKPLWSPDGGSILFSSGPPSSLNVFQHMMGGLGVVTCDGTDLTWIIDSGKDGPMTTYPNAWSPDGDSLAFLASDAWEEEAWLCVANRHDGSVERWVDLNEVTDWYMSVDTCRLEWRSDGIHVVFRTRGDGSGDQKQWFVTLRDGLVVAVRMTILPLPLNAHQLALSPDGNQIAYLDWTRERTHTLRVIDLDADDSSTCVNLDDQLGLAIRHCSTPAWSPDGRFIAYVIVGFGFDGDEINDEDFWSGILVVSSDGATQHLAVPGYIESVFWESLGPRE